MSDRSLWTKDRKEEFISRLKEMGSAQALADSVGCSRMAIYKAAQNYGTSVSKILGGLSPRQGAARQETKMITMVTADEPGFDSKAPSAPKSVALLIVPIQDLNSVLEGLWR